LLVDFLVVDDDLEQFLALLKFFLGLPQQLTKKIVGALDGYVETQQIKEFSFHLD